jgi:hypothetical protein
MLLKQDISHSEARVPSRNIFFVFHIRRVGNFQLKIQAKSNGRIDKIYFTHTIQPLMRLQRSLLESPLGACFLVNSTRFNHTGPSSGIYIYTCIYSDSRKLLQYYITIQPVRAVRLNIVLFKLILVPVKI